MNEPRPTQAPSPEQDARLDALALLAESEREELPARLARQDRAAAESSVAGTLRRALLKSFVQTRDVAESTGVALDLLLDWQEGLVELPLSALEKIAHHLGLVIAVVEDPQPVSS